MKEHIIKFRSGEKTCASEAGKFCRFIGSRNFGQWPVCMLFGVRLFSDGEGGMGWIQRCSECMKEFK